MSTVKTEAPPAAPEPDCFIVSVAVKTATHPRAAIGVSTDTENATPSTPSRRSRPYAISYVNAQAATPSRAQAPSPSSRAAPSVPLVATPRKRDRSRSPAGGSPPSTSKRNRTASVPTGTRSSGSPAPNFYDAESNLGDGGEAPRDQDRLIFSPEAASTPAASGESSRNIMSSPPIPCRLNTSSFTTQRHRSSSSSSSSSSVPFPSPSRTQPATIKIESNQSFNSTIPSSSSPSSSQSQSSKRPRIVRNPNWNFEVDTRGKFTNVYDHWDTLPALLPKNGPVCKMCKSPSRLDITSDENDNGNARRPFYKCQPCKNWITWGDLEGCDVGNVKCRCRRRARTMVCGDKSKCPGKRFWKCASGFCDFMDWEPTWEWDNRMGNAGDGGEDDGEAPWPGGEEDPEEWS
ncbi:hypothetical protein QBC44DRAFT_373057 [Cladorrhinum sp. PSN332]|nr:hypothetical protein QBC44DRAFT_373057 [Cladorrhinum sp. PSN332]